MKNKVFINGIQCLPTETVIFHYSLSECDNLVTWLNDKIEELKKLINFKEFKRFLKPANINYARCFYNCEDDFPFMLTFHIGVADEFPTISLSAIYEKK